MRPQVFADGGVAVEPGQIWPGEIWPGQIWLVEQPAESGLSALDRAALGRANVILYDRALERLVEEALPLGSYAEPLSREAAAAASALARRAVEFAAAGWSVMQLIEPLPGSRARLRQTADALMPRPGCKAAAVRVIARAAARGQRQASLAGLAAVIDEFAADNLLTLVIGPLAESCAGPALAFTANGLAG